ncbi:MAG: redoxin domain-containing protein [Myxococcota bacterium]
MKRLIHRPMRRRALLGGAAGATLLGCESGSGDVPLPISGTGQDFDETCALNDSDVPAGLSPGNRLDNFSFDGYLNPDRTGIGVRSRVELSLCSFLNETGEEVWDEGFPYPAGSPKPLALFINFAAVWCQPCRFEAAEILPEEYDIFQPRGMELLSILADSAAVGEPATFDDLDDWVSTYTVRYAAVIDPTRALSNQLNNNQFPSNLLIDTRDLTVITNLAGVPEPSFFDPLEQLLLPPSAPG